MNDINYRFIHACKKIIDVDRERCGIGTLGEKTVHAVLKHYFEPCENYHEIKIGRYFADISNQNGIIEIQTRNFNALRKKLELFLSDHVVTIVYPIPSTKWIIWMDTNTGEVTAKRKSPKRGSPYDAFYELYKIKYLLTHENLRLCLLLLDVEEYRRLDGWSHDKKRGSTRSERIPTAIIQEICINCSSDFSMLIPPCLPESFTAKDYKKASKLTLSKAQTALNVLHYVGAVQRVAKQGNAYIYKCL